MSGLGRVVIYSKKVEETAAFYRDHFGFEIVRRPKDRIVELRPKTGAAILLHQAGKGQREGQVLVKLVFDVEDVAAAHDALIAKGVDVGPIHQADGYAFANLTDPSKNPVQISSRAFAHRG